MVCRHCDSKIMIKIFFRKGGEVLDSARKRRNHSKDSELLMVLRLIRLKITFMTLNVCLKSWDQKSVKIPTCVGSVHVFQKVRQKQNVLYSGEKEYKLGPYLCGVSKTSLCTSWIFSAWVATSIDLYAQVLLYQHGGTRERLALKSKF